MNCKVKYSKELLASVAKDSLFVADVIRKIGLKQSGSNHSHIKRRLLKYGIDLSHFLGSRVNSGPRHVGGNEKLNEKQVLVFDRHKGRREPAARLKRVMLEVGFKEECEICKLGPKWMGKPLTLHIDHKDGNGLNNLKENLRFLCPHCHSQTDNYGAKNIKMEP